MTTSTITYALGALQVLFAAVGWYMGWIEQPTAFGLLIPGLATFGITFNQVKLGKELGKKV